MMPGNRAAGGMSRAATRAPSATAKPDQSHSRIERKVTSAFLSCQRNMARQSDEKWIDCKSDLDVDGIVAAHLLEPYTQLNARSELGRH